MLWEEHSEKYIYLIIFSKTFCSNTTVSILISTHTAPILVMLQLWRVRKKNYKFLTYMHVHMYWGDVKWYVRTVVGTMYSYTDFDDDIFPLLRRNFIFIWFAVFLIFIFFSMKADGIACIYIVWMYLFISRHDTTMKYSYYELHVLYLWFKICNKRECKCSYIYNTVNRR